MPRTAQFSRWSHNRALAEASSYLKRGTLQAYPIIFNSKITNLMKILLSVLLHATLTRALEKCDYLSENPILKFSNAGE
jgi:hypothetical protein